MITLGETMALLKTEGVGPLSHAGSLTIGIGGAESNVAVALKRLGAPATWIGRIGDDSFGQLIQRELLAEGVNALCISDPSASTGLMIKERRTPNSIRVSYYRGDSAGSHLGRGDIPCDLFPRAQLLHFTGITPALSDSAADAVRYAIECAKVAGLAISFDLNYRSSLWSAQAARKAYLELIPQCDIVFAGDDEAAIAVGEADSPTLLAKRLVALGPTEAVIKLGASGCVALVDEERYHQPAIAIEAVDTVGAGDAFVGGYLGELLAGKTVPQRLLTAVRTGAFACLVPGDWEGLPRRSELALLEVPEPVIR
ncbi:sugar kinase [Arthrobacter sp. TMN-50]